MRRSVLVKMAATVLLTTTLPAIISTGVVAATVRRVFPQQGKGAGEDTAHWHYRGRNKAVKHSHPGGHISHMHRGLPGYGRTKSTLRR